MKDLLIVKIGGNIIDDEQALSAFIADFAAIGTPKILVHGGGKIATELSTRLGIETKMTEGRRITDEETIRVVTMTYAGWINKTIVAKLQSIDITALGLSGVDANIIPAVRRPVLNIDYGWVGNILTDKINSAFLSKLIDDNIVPVIAPISSNSEGHLLNVNADTVAQSLAEALSTHYDTTLVYCFEKKGLLSDVNDEASVIREITQEQAAELKAKGTITKGMIPTIDNALKAIGNGVKKVVIGHAYDIKMIALKQVGYGTSIKA
jgi:acetylglutamate kinase